MKTLRFFLRIEAPYPHAKREVFPGMPGRPWKDTSLTKREMGG